ncbi:hypothetical protein BC830DRAFT_1133149 [Chytriomyces sp. MP71]|nr:hypothetical protein BC830DRAFT_1133149 [Chytriomyces sp. MP71]
MKGNWLPSLRTANTLGCVNRSYCNHIYFDCLYVRSTDHRFDLNLSGSPGNSAAVAVLCAGRLCHAADEGRDMFFILSMSSAMGVTEVKWLKWRFAQGSLLESRMGPCKPLPSLLSSSSGSRSHPFSRQTVRVEEKVGEREDGGLATRTGVARIKLNAGVWDSYRS